MVTFEGYERRIEKINATLKQYGISSLEEAKEAAKIWLSTDFSEEERHARRIAKISAIEAKYFK